MAETVPSTGNSNIDNDRQLQGHCSELFRSFDSKLRIAHRYTKQQAREHDLLAIRCRLHHSHKLRPACIRHDMGASIPKHATAILTYGGTNELPTM